jgi:hypothetical protein
MKQYIHKRSFVCFLITALLLSGCAKTGSNVLDKNSSTTNSADTRLTSGKGAEFFSKSGYQACIVGASVAIGSCILLSSKDKAQCAITAGIAACGVAMGANYYLDNRRVQYADTTQRLQAMDADIQNDTNAVVERTNTAKQVIADNNKTLTQISLEKDNTGFDKVAAQQKLAKVDANISLLKNELGNMHKKAYEYQSVINGEQSGASTEELSTLTAKIGDLNSQISVLEKEVNGLYDQRSAITLG